MTGPFMACHKFDLNFDFKVTMIIEIFHIWTFGKGHQLLGLDSEDFHYESW